MLNAQIESKWFNHERRVLHTDIAWVEMSLSSEGEDGYPSTSLIQQIRVPGREVAQEVAQDDDGIIGPEASCVQNFDDDSALRASESAMHIRPKVLQTPGKGLGLWQEIMLEKA